MKSAFLLSKSSCVYVIKQNNTWLLVDMEFLFSCSTRHPTRSLRSLESYRVKHSKRNSISTRAYVLFSPHIYINFLFLSISFFFFFRLSGVLHSCGVLIHRDSSSGTNIVTNEWKLGNKHNVVIKSAIIYCLGGGRGNRRRILERITSFSGETNGGSVSHC